MPNFAENRTEEETATVPLSSIELPYWFTLGQKSETNLEKGKEGKTPIRGKEDLVVRPLPEEDKYELVSGYASFRALKKMGFTRFPVLIKDISDEEMVSLALDQYLQEDQLSFSEKAHLGKILPLFRLYMCLYITFQNEEGNASRTFQCISIMKLAISAKFLRIALLKNFLRVSCGVSRKLI